MEAQDLMLQTKLKRDILMKIVLVYELHMIWYNTSNLKNEYITCKKQHDIKSINTSHDAYTSRPHELQTLANHLPSV